MSQVPAATQTLALLRALADRGPSTATALARTVGAPRSTHPGGVQALWAYSPRTNVGTGISEARLRLLGQILAQVKQQMSVGAHLAAMGVQMWGGVTYQHFDAQGLHILRDGQPQILQVDDVVICTGQDADVTLATALTAAQIPHHLIGGAAAGFNVITRHSVKTNFE